MSPKAHLSSQSSLCDTADIIFSQTVTIFAYGVTSSGKTHTMQGTKSDPGVIPRVVRVRDRTSLETILFSLFSRPCLRKVLIWNDIRFRLLYHTWRFIKMRYMTSSLLERMCVLQSTIWDIFLGNHMDILGPEAPCTRKRCRYGVCCQPQLYSPLFC